MLIHNAHVALQPWSEESSYPSLRARIGFQATPKKLRGRPFHYAAL